MLFWRAYFYLFICYCNYFPPLNGIFKAVIELWERSYFLYKFKLICKIKNNFYISYTIALNLWEIRLEYLNVFPEHLQILFINGLKMLPYPSSFKVFFQRCRNLSLKLSSEFNITLNLNTTFEWPAKHCFYKFHCGYESLVYEESLEWHSFFNFAKSKA